MSNDIVLISNLALGYMLVSHHVSKNKNGITLVSAEVVYLELLMAHI